MNTPFVQLYFTLEPPADNLAPYALFALRQQFHAAFRRAAGCFSFNHACMAGIDCPCCQVFEQTLATDPAALRRYQKPPLPFAFKIPVLPGRFSAGEETEIALVVAGEAIRHLDLFVKAVRGLFLPGGIFKDWLFVAVEAAAFDCTRITIPDDGAGGKFASLPILSFDELFSAGNGYCQRVSLKVHTPTRIIHKGSPVQDLSFSTLVGALFRRSSSLAYYYGREELPHDFKWLAMQSQKVVSTYSELRWVKRGGSMQGVEGSVEFSGELTEFIPFLQLGSVLNVGKGAAYGMGSYSISIG